LTLSSKDDLSLMIQIDDSQGVTVSSSKEIAITAKQDITFNSGGKLSISAAEEIQLHCQESQITLNDQIEIDGMKINREM
jgi:uncharacterized protein (DUF2345 family)